VVWINKAVEQQLGLARIVDPIIRNAAFSAPVTRAEGGADLFSLRAEVRP